MRELLNKWPLHVLFFVLYFIFFLYTKNETHLPFNVVYKPIIYGVLFVSVELLVVNIVLRDKLKAGLIVTAINIPILNYGIIYDVLEKLYVKGYWPLGNIHRYLLIAIAIYFVFVYLWQRKERNGNHKITYFLNVFFITLLTINLFSLIFTKRSEIEAIQVAKAEMKKDVKASELPDLYFIMLDGYANQHILKKYYQFDNSFFLDQLKSYGFYIADSSVANYYSTLLSLNATFNLNYNSDLANTQRNLDNNIFFSDLKNYGYKIYSLESGYSVTSTLHNVDSLIPINAPTEFERILLKYTIFKLDDLFGLMHHHRIAGQIEKLDKIAKIKGGPNFFFIHFVSPHPPYVFNSNGDHVYGFKNNTNSWEPRESYIQQLMYMNKIINDFVIKISKNKDAAIVIQSDHGPWIKSSNHQDIFEARSMVLNAIRYPKMNDSLINKKISLINTFRIFHKVYFKDNMKLLKDSLAGKSILERAVLFNDLKQVETN